MHSASSSSSSLSVRRLLRGLACAFYGVGLVPALPLAATLLVVAETAAGRLYAVAALAALAAPAAFLYLRLAREYWQLDSWKHAFPLQLALGTCLVLVPALFWLAPGGNSVPGATVHSIHLEPARYPRMSPWNLLPEIDQVKLGTLFVSAFDPFIDRPQSRRLRDLFLPHFRRMQRNPSYRDLGSAMPATYRDLSGLGTEPGHAYTLLPPTSPGEQLPMLVFLHGSWGNFRLYAAALEDFALENRIVVVIPTLGFGTWPENDAVPFLRRVLDHSLESYPVDPNRVFLAGISNGSFGVASAAEPLADQLAGLIFVSPILQQDSFESRAFATALRDRHVLVLHGEVDRRIPLASVQAGVRLLESKGLRMTVHTYPSEDHFLFLSQLEDVQGRMAQFIQLTGR